MNPALLDRALIGEFRLHLIREEKSAATVTKYIRDVRRFSLYAKAQPITKELVMAYKQTLLDQHYAVRSINSMLASINCLLEYMNLNHCRVKSMKLQRPAYCAEERQLSKSEYLRLLDAAKGQTQLRLIMQTICATGIRVSELRWFTVECVRAGETHIDCKGKHRIVLIPGKLRKRLLEFARVRGITSGAIFRNQKGTPMNRTCIWAQMKALCRKANVSPSKVFPHNLRKLFARTFYKLEKDIAKLADILGHSSIDTTRIYIMTTGTEHRQQMERLGLVV